MSSAVRNLSLKKIGGDSDGRKLEGKKLLLLAFHLQDMTHCGFVGQSCQSVPRIDCNIMFTK